MKATTPAMEMTREATERLQKRQERLRKRQEGPADPRFRQQRLRKLSLRQRSRSPLSESQQRRDDRLSRRRERERKRRLRKQQRNERYAWGGVGRETSPAQRFFGRRCKTLLPMTHSQLEPLYSTADDARALRGQRAKQRLYYDRNAKDLPPIHKGDVVRMRLPGQITWTPGVCIGQCCPRSYRVRVDGREFRRNRRQLIHSGEQPLLEPPVIEQDVATRPDIRDTHRAAGAGDTKTI